MISVYRLVPGCFAFKDRYHIVNFRHGVMVVDQPQRGFRTVNEGVNFLIEKFAEISARPGEYPPHLVLVRGDQIDGAR